MENWKWNSVHLVQKNRSARQCLWALSMNSTKNNKYNKKKPPLGIWLRIRGYLDDTASRINDYLARRESTRRQWADQASHCRQSSDPAITFDDVYALTSALADIRRLHALRLAIQNWIIAFANAKIVMIQSAVRGCLIRSRSGLRERVLISSLPVDRWWSNFPDDPDGPTSPTLNCVAGCQHRCCSQNIVVAYDKDEIYDEWDIIIIQRWWRSHCAARVRLLSGNGPVAFNSMVSWLGSRYQGLYDRSF